MLLVYVAFYFVAIMVGVILPSWVWFGWWGGDNTVVSMGTVVAVACIAWVLGFWNWLKELGE